jgi:small subunit ribosomal protein S2
MYISIKELLEAGCHFGHQTKFWNPKMAPYIYGSRNKIHIINLETTAVKLAEALSFIERLSANNSKILFVGAKRSSREIVANEANRANCAYVDQRWLGGMLTNFKTVKASIKKLKQMDETALDPKEIEQLTKKEQLLFDRNRTKLRRDLGGIENMNGLPDALFVIDVGHHKIAIAEAQKLGIPIIGVVDTNYSPEGIDYMIPSNDDSSAAVACILKYVTDAVLSGREKAGQQLLQAVRSDEENEQAENQANDTDNA